MRCERRLVLVEHPSSWSGHSSLAAARAGGIAPILLTTDRGRYERAWQSFAPDPLADLVTVVETDTHDTGAVLDAVRGLESVAGLMSFDDYHCVVAAEAAESLGLPGPSPRAMRTAVRKDLLRTALSGSPVSLRHQVVDDERELDRAAALLGFPLVIKPPAEASSFGVSLVHTGAALHEEFTRLRARRVNRRGRPCEPQVLLEEYAQGPEYSVESVTVAGVTHFYGATEKVMVPGSFVEAGHAFPAGLSENDCSSLESAVLRTLTAIGLDHGPCHTELRLTRSGPKIIEVNPRQGGGYIATLVEYVCGRNPFLDGMTAAVGLGLPELARSPTVKAAAWRKLFVDRTGTLAAVEGVDTIRDSDGVRLVHLSRAPGDAVTVPTENSHAIGNVVATGDTPQEALRSATRAVTHLRPTIHGADTAEGPAPLGRVRGLEA